MVMVFRGKSPQQIIEDAGIGRRSKIILVILLVIFVTMGYQLITTRNNNQLLTVKNEKLRLRVVKFTNGYKHCDRSLKTSRNMASRLHDTSKLLQRKVSVFSISSNHKDHCQNERPFVFVKEWVLLCWPKPSKDLREFSYLLRKRKFTGHFRLKIPKKS